jgi:Fic family protein
MKSELHDLPPRIDLETRAILKKTATAHRYLAELNRLSATIPNKEILINHLFYHPYTKIDFLERDLNVSRLTATKYLDTLAKAGFLKKEKIGRSNYYVNVALFRILTGK